MPSNQRQFHQVKWVSVKHEVEKLAPDIYEAIHTLALDDEYRLYEACYPYGDLIINNGGILHIPNEEGDLVPITHKSIPKQVREDLGYNKNSTPLGLVCEGVYHLFNEEIPNQVSTAHVYGKNAMLASRVVLDDAKTFHTPAYWKACSGCRTPVILASLGSDICYRRIKSIYNLSLKKPEEQCQQFGFFRELANSTAFKTPWVTRILFFSKKWNPTQDRPELQLFRYKLLERSWKSSNYARHLFTINKVWSKFSLELRHKMIREYHRNFARYVLECALGVIPCSQLYTFDDVAGPFNEIIRILLDQYLLPHHAPLLMLPGYHNPMNREQVSYISMNLPTNNLKKVRAVKNDSLMGDQHLVKYILKEFQEKIINREILFTDSMVYNLKDIQFDFYHTNPDKFHETILTEKLFEHDFLQKTFPHHPKNQNLCVTNEFIRACIKISSHKKSRGMSK